VALKESEQRELRDRAIRSLSEAGVSTAELAKLYDGMDESTLRDRLIRLFAERGDKAGVEKLIDIAKNDSNTELRRRAIRKLGETGDPRAKQFLEDRVK
jgi:HEAT repeat protein